MLSSTVNPCPDVPKRYLSVLHLHSTRLVYGRLEEKTRGNFTCQLNYFIERNLRNEIYNKYRRKIFLIPGVEEAFKRYVTQTCAEHQIDILAMECHIDHVHMFVSVFPQQSIPEVMRMIKGCTSHTLRQEFPELSGMSSLWTRSYFVSTAGDDAFIASVYQAIAEVHNQFVAEGKKRLRMLARDKRYRYAKRYIQEQGLES